ncbi:YgfZ/GcvT domain-containing protein [Pseudorhodobacter ferrugineus]|uniref:CAF17-like 4Fe-4S cluster assembly/insertion protein YgfZ n=1 Tax=Pseudorhodobacter ferrugineus TaxID=77008 RepID=UPI0003B34509|nr:folate-binding protein YgfZ [Pseudorhodobacter ferrugineus]
MTTRTIVSVTGKDAATFLQGLLTNDITRLASAPGLAWTGVLTPQGKYLADFFVLGTADGLHLDLPTALADDLLKRLSMYKLRADVHLTPAHDIHVTRGLGHPPAGAAYPDPRHAALGWRHYGPTAGAKTNTDWDAIRVAHLIPETMIELIPNDSYILEWGFERLHGVDFRKGCYVGQEVTARMKHKTELRKGIARVSVSAPVPVGTEIMAGDKPVGQIFTQSNGQAIAYLRYDRATDAMTAGGAAVVYLGTG